MKKTKVLEDICGGASGDILLRKFTNTSIINLADLGSFEMDNRNGLHAYVFEISVPNGVSIILAQELLSPCESFGEGRCFELYPCVAGQGVKICFDDSGYSAIQTGECL